MSRSGGGGSNQGGGFVIDDLVYLHVEREAPDGSKSRVEMLCAKRFLALNDQPEHASTMMLSIRQRYFGWTIYVNMELTSFFLLDLLLHYTPLAVGFYI